MYIDESLIKQEEKRFFKITLKEEKNEEHLYSSTNLLKIKILKEKVEEERVPVRRKYRWYVENCLLKFSSSLTTPVLSNKKKLRYTFLVERQGIGLIGRN